MTDKASRCIRLDNVQNETCVFFIKFVILQLNLGFAKSTFEVDFEIDEFVIKY